MPALVPDLQRAVVLRDVTQTRDMPVIMITGADDSASVESEYAAGATDFVSKPVPWSVLIRRIRIPSANSRRSTLQNSSRCPTVGELKTRAHYDGQRFIVRDATQPKHETTPRSQRQQCDERTEAWED